MPLEYTLVDLLRAALMGAFVMWILIAVFYSMGPPTRPKDPPPPGPLGPV